MNTLSPDALHAARQRIAEAVHHTPVMHSRALDAAADARLFFKCENFQQTGAFKARGATNAVFSLSAEQASRGVATHSSGNHGQALARAAAARGIRATVVMPETAPRPKIEAVRGYGADIIFCAPTNAARQTTLDAFVADTRAEFIAPYDDVRVIAGQASCAAELIDDVPDLDAVIAPVGGGGLISGTALTISALAPHIAVHGGEPSAADDAARSLESGQRCGNDAPQTIADGLKASLGAITWPIVRDHVTAITRVSEDEIVTAMRLIWQRMKIIVEPSCAVALAAVLAAPEHFANRRVGVILTGGNVDLDRLPW
ncbi:pyridoxal-phosphate dependent enzyme [Salinisphaera sp. Q1T1-3]|uniref:pyridoxal-phosphate dependent enzyme n=1 Tax=Salinisphaera sp. Q1T1-3 TaxID=2321229 RepID=UPI000E752988|nr:pyridoxal-phosphate dependent enzyme [Salinisphaera sp. Q1T1-3]RJS93052.1 pyridoxal-phosphate dependent enzyme [Salinisphaera sp. Q1T1-3]